MYDFNWRMTEQDWNNLKKGTGNCCGSVLVGSMCIEFICDDIPYTNSFVAGMGNYSQLEDGTYYDLVGWDYIDIDDLLREESFDNFQKHFEAMFNQICEDHFDWAGYARQEGSWPWK